MVETRSRAVDRINTQPRHGAADAIRLNNMFRGRDTIEMLETVLKEQMLGDAATVSSFGTEAIILLHLIARFDRALPVLFLDTGKHFPETLAYRDDVVMLLGLTDVRSLTPAPADIAAKDETGLRWSYDPDGCCTIRKVKPLEQALAGFDAQISGRKAFQSTTRAALPRFEVEAGRLKMNPLADWGKDRIDAYFADYALPRHPLEVQGYPSIGCAPCTSRVQPGEDPRAGRWRGWDKTECGIHSITRPADDNGANDPVF